VSAAGATNVGKRITNMEVSPEFDGYSKVVILVTDDLFYEAGVNTGRTLELKCPWGTQQMAEDILANIRGYQYQPFTADGAIVDPSAELGDGITVNGVYSGLYKQEMQFDALCASKIEAPQDEELDHEYPFQEVTDREVIRQHASVKAQFAVQASEIAARVTREGGDNASFGWSLTEDGFILSSGSKEVFKATEDGIEVTGKISATSGYIGNSSQGFEITSNAIRNGVLSMSDTGHLGVYIGTDGIVLGKGAFKVNSNGIITATSGTIGGFTLGETYIKGGNLTLNSDGSIVGKDWSISADGRANFKNFNGVGSFSGGGASFGGGGASLPTSVTVGGTSLANYVDSIVANKISANYLNTVYGTSNYLRVHRFTYQYTDVAWITVNGYRVLGCPY